jgi:peptidoglycan L-alanyl-D-glutamate endopeptidase CwlK
MHKLSKRSEDILATCLPEIQKVMKLAISRSAVDFGISHGFRSPEEQNKLFQQGRDGNPGEIVTHKDGYRNKSKHNLMPSHAVDIFCWPREIMYDEKHLCYVAGIVMSCAAELGVKLRWGNNWNNDGLLVCKDPSERFSDMPHFEI